MSEESRTAWVYAKIDEEDKDALMSIAGYEGKHVTVVVKDAVQYYIGEWAANQDNPDDPDVQLRSMFHSNRKTQNRFIMLKQLAYTWNDTGADEDYETLERACEIAGVQIETVIESINQSSSFIPTAVSGDATGMQAAMIWLNEIVIETGKMVDVSDLQRMAEDRGFKWHTVTAAKRKMGIQSVRNGSGWAWLRSPDNIGSMSPNGD